MATDEQQTALAAWDKRPSGADPRSAEYRQGWIAAYAARLAGVKLPRPFPYAMGTVQADAWLAGIDHGQQQVRADAFARDEQLRALQSRIHDEIRKLDDSE